MYVANECILINMFQELRKMKQEKIIFSYNNKKMRININ